MYVDGRRLYSLKEVAQIMGIDYMTCWRHVRSGQIPATKVGERIRIRGVDINAYLKQRQVKAA